MPFGIVTGFTEVEHITPHNLKALNAAVAGSGNYVLKIGKQLQASMQTANKLRVLDGYGMMGGAQWGMEPGEYVDLTIDNGTQGMNRIDLVVARYDRTGSKNIESVTLRVIKGTPSSGTPSAPAFVTGDILAGAATAEMPLYKVQLSVLTVAAPVAMYEVLTPSKDAWDSASRYSTSEVNTGQTWIDGKPIYRKVVVLSSIGVGGIRDFDLGVTSSITVRGVVAENGGRILPGIIANGGPSNIAYWSKSAVFTASSVQVGCGSEVSFAGGWAIFEYVK